MLYQPTPAPISRGAWFPKFLECLFVAIGFFGSFFMLLPLLRPLLLRLGEAGVGFLLGGIIIISLIGGLAFSILWHLREKRNAINSPRLHAWCRGILRYWLAFSISIYGFGKIFRTQFHPSFSRNDTPVGELSGFDLTWNYFGHSYLFAVLIALVQIGGSIFLLFRRTTLLGAAILLPVMVNILLINLFYHIAAGAFLNSILFTGGLAYLLWLRAPDLIKVFFHPGNRLPIIHPYWLKYAGRLLAIGGAFVYIAYAVHNNPDSPLDGKWSVDYLVRNQDTVKQDAWMENSGAWRTVYLERFNQFSLCPNPYIFDKARSLAGRFDYDSTNHRLLLYMGGPVKYNDTVVTTVSNYDGKHMDWKGVMGKDTLFFKLSRAQ